jgi:hypothetical protein
MNLKPNAKQNKPKKTHKNILKTDNERENQSDFLNSDPRSF